ncbi:hypothetical protein NDU88_005665 [Pleurodeles waltl]|uniref:Uncharacterized protein n=1 Tax=Pleurodeles waltl TaxID=8319 RepID=A0AAV7N0V0_PLEWA|nr:hypothetical protein NDU88_005665 [Pleurodeles waltl]
MGFSAEAVPSTSRETVLPQFKKLPSTALPIHQFAMDALLNEWRDPEHITLPCFMAKLYTLEEMEGKLPETFHVDSILASLVGRPSMAEENIVKDVANKNVDSSVKKAYAGTHLALRAGVHGAYVAQSLLTDFKTFFKTMQEDGQCPDLLERQSEYIFEWLEY